MWSTLVVHQVERLETELRVLERQRVERSDDDDVGARVDRRDDLGGEAGRCVDDHVVDGRARPRARRAAVSVVIALAWSGRRGASSARTPGGVLDEERLELVPVERAARERQVVDRLLGREPESERDVAELEVEVDDHDALADSRRGRPRGCRGERLAGPALGAEHADERGAIEMPLSVTPPRPRASTFCTAKRICSGRLREGQDVVGPGLEGSPEEPVRRALAEDDDRDCGRGAMRVVDDLERPIVLAALAGDEQDVHVTRLERPNRLVDAVGHPEQLEARVVGHRPLDVERVEPFDGDECADRALHDAASSLRYRR